MFYILNMLSLISCKILNHMHNVKDLKTKNLWLTMQC